MGVTVVSVKAFEDDDANDGTQNTAGLMTLDQKRRQNQLRAEKRARELEIARKAQDEVGGDPQIVRRDPKTGKILNAQEFDALQNKNKKKVYERQDAKKWGTGMEQQREQDARDEDNRKLKEM